MRLQPIYYRVAPALRAILRPALRNEHVLLINHPHLQLPADVLQEIAATRPAARQLRFLIRVNPSLDSGLSTMRVQANVSLLIKLLTLKVLGLGRGVLRGSIAVARKASAELNALRARDLGNPFNSAGCQPAATTEPAAPANRLSGARSRWKRRFKNIYRALLAAHTRAVQRTEHSIAPESVPAGPLLSAFVLVSALEHLPGFAFPQALHVALTTHCNLKCIMCPYHADELRPHHTTGYFENSKRMPADLLKKLIAEAGRHRSHLGFGQYDEPFVYRDFTDYAVLAKQQGCAVSITTNGTLLTEDLARRLIAAGVDHISFSLDAATEETYRKIRLADYRIPLENIKTLVRVRDELRGPTTLRACLVVQEHNRHEQELFRDRMKAIGLDMVSFYVLSQLVDGIWMNERLNFDIEAPAPGQRHACSQLWSQVAVYPDGNVALCCATTMYVGYRADVPYVGNIKDSTVAEIWRSSEYRKIRAEALAGIFSNSVCRDCQIWHNHQHHESRDAHGHLVQQNPYETFVYLKPAR